MNSNIFKDCLARKQIALQDGRPFWPELAQKYGMTPEELRSAFRREYAKHQDKFVDERRFPIITLLDIETLPIIGYVWTPWDINMSVGQIIEPTAMLSWSAKTLFSSKMKSDIMTPEEAIERDDGRISQSLWEIMNGSDIVIGHNINGFDIKKMNSRFLVHGFNPPKPSQVIDTLDTAKKLFGFDSNKQEFLAMMLLSDHKIKTDFDLWKRCDNGDKAALDEMLKYNKYDVTLLEEIYLTIRPWMKGHPNLGLYTDEIIPVCNNCGSANVTADGYYYTPANRFDSYHCGNCGAYTRARVGNLEKEKKEVLLRN
jgi:hypothetical protein